MDIDKYTADVTSSVSSNSVTVERDGTVMVVMSGTQDAVSINTSEQKATKLIKELGYKPNVIIDVRNMGFPDGSARKAIIASFNTDNYNRQAIFGLNEALRIIATLLLSRVAFRNRTKLCKTEVEARAWLAKSPANKQFSRAKV